MTTIEYDIVRMLNHENVVIKNAKLVNDEIVITFETNIGLQEYGEKENILGGQKDIDKIILFGDAKKFNKLEITIKGTGHYTLKELKS
jgi:hypothetical protein